MADERSDQKRSSQATVFGASDQSEMISRLDAVEDDDLDSGFFEASVQDAADAAVRMFDVGIRAMAEEPDGTGASPFTSASTGASARPPVESSTASAPTRPRFEDPAIRAAFILGGPDAL
ncbi:MAG: hypothetical protein WAO50_08675 [Candidatus Nanopelagicales bacterium]|jgi:hypothetical protein